MFFMITNGFATVILTCMHMDVTRERAIETLERQKKAIDSDINQYAVEMRQELAEQYSADMALVMDGYFEILRRGGKRLRGVLAIEAYKLFGGSDNKLALRLARVLEMLHAYLLVVDDVADQSDLRRGGPTAHRLLEARHKDAGWAGDSAHYGRSQALNAGLIGQNLAFRELIDLPIKESVRADLLAMVNNQLITTGIGQVSDIQNEAERVMDELLIKQTLQWKTAYYTFMLPLKAGALLAGAKSKEAEFLNSYAVHMGTAFQVADDIIGVFGSPSKSGKSNRDDITEGKRTLLVSYAYRHGSQADKRALDAALGNRQLTDAQYKRFCEALRNSGAATYAKQVVKTAVKNAASSLEAAAIDQDKLVFLYGLAEIIGEV